MDKTCEKCRQSFSCGAPTGDCWCMSLPIAKEIPATFTDCLCPKCLPDFLPKDSAPLVEGVDYYLDENKNFVFTEAHHLKRGHCCHSGCRHCPY